MFLVFSGLPGTGKSVLAHRIGKELQVPVLSVDPIEAALVRAGLIHGFETGLAAYLVAEALADSQLSLGQGVIVDAVNAVEPAKDLWRSMAVKHSQHLHVIECRCSDEELHQRRLYARQRNLGGLPEPTWDEVAKRRMEFTQWTEQVLVLDATAALEANTARALQWLRDSKTNR